MTATITETVMTESEVEAAMVTVREALASCDPTCAPYLHQFCSSECEADAARQALP